MAVIAEVSLYSSLYLPVTALLYFIVLEDEQANINVLLNMSYFIWHCHHAYSYSYWVCLHSFTRLSINFIGLNIGCNKFRGGVPMIVLAAKCVSLLDIYYTRIATWWGIEKDCAKSEIEHLSIILLFKFVNECLLVQK